MCLLSELDLVSHLFVPIVIECFGYKLYKLVKYIEKSIIVADSAGCSQMLGCLVIES